MNFDRGCDRKKLDTFAPQVSKYRQDDTKEERFLRQIRKSKELQEQRPWITKDLALRTAAHIVNTEMMAEIRIRRKARMLTERYLKFVKQRKAA